MPYYKPCHIICRSVTSLFKPFSSEDASIAVCMWKYVEFKSEFSKSSNNQHWSCIGYLWGIVWWNTNFCRIPNTYAYGRESIHLNKNLCNFFNNQWYGTIYDAQNKYIQKVVWVARHGIATDFQKLIIMWETLCDNIVYTSYSTISSEFVVPLKRYFFHYRAKNLLRNRSTSHAFQGTYRD